VCILIKAPRTIGSLRTREIMERGVIKRRSVCWEDATVLVGEVSANAQGADQSMIRESGREDNRLI
jgi:hypothetical protein